MSEERRCPYCGETSNPCRCEKRDIGERLDALETLLLALYFSESPLTAPARPEIDPVEIREAVKLLLHLREQRELESRS